MSGCGCGGQGAVMLHARHPEPLPEVPASVSNTRTLLVAGPSRTVGKRAGAEQCRCGADPRVHPATPADSLTGPHIGAYSVVPRPGMAVLGVTRGLDHDGGTRTRDVPLKCNVGVVLRPADGDTTSGPPTGLPVTSPRAHLGVPRMKSCTMLTYADARASVARLPADWQLLASGVDVVGTGWLRDALLAGERVVSTPAGGCLIRPSAIRTVARAVPRAVAKAAPEAGRPCAFVPRSVASFDVASLRDVCGINLGPSRYFSTAPFFGELFASLPPDFMASSSHDEFLAFALPTWFSRIHASTPEAWDAAFSALNPSIWDGDPPEWKAKGLYWQNSEGFLARALRYALVTAYAFAWATESIPTFSTACRIDRNVLRNTISGAALDPITKERWRLDVARMCEYTKDGVDVSAFGLVQPRRHWNGLWVGITPRFWTTLNDGVQVSAALADYHFSWAIRLFDFARAGHSENPIADLWMSICCARAALAEIVDIAGLLVHELAHTTNPFDSQQECRADSGKQECCRFNLRWYFCHRIAAEFALPLAALPNMADDDERIDFLRPHETTFDGQRHRFDFDADEYWQFTYHSGTDANTDSCIPAELEGTHHGLWQVDHALGIAWNYPDGCADGSNSGQMLLNA